MIWKDGSQAGRATVILGAGASRGEEHAQSKVNPAVLPPLDADFFNELQKVERHNKAAGELLSVFRDLFGAGPDITMEQFYTEIEFLEQVELFYPADPCRPRSDAYRRAREVFTDALLAVFEAAGLAQGGTPELVEGGKGMAPLCHSAVVEKLEPGDTIISFNYDLLVDRALKHRRIQVDGPWEPSVGYGVAAGGKTDYWRGIPPAAEPSHASIRLLKMHGSVHWQQDGDGKLVLVEPPFQSSKMLIVPPAWHKKELTFPLAVIADTWVNARKALVNCDVLAIIGYSLPRTDMWTKALLRATIADRRERPLGDVLVANPDSDATNRLLRFLAPAIGKQTRVIGFTDFLQLRGFLQ